MPRPPVKRSKLNNSNQAAKRVPSNPLSSSPAARRRQLLEQLAHKDVGRVPNDSDDSDELVVKSRNPRNRRGVPRQEIYGSGGVAQGDKVAAHKSPSNKRQRVSTKEVSRPGARSNGLGKDAPPKSRGLRPINRLSTSQLARSITSKVPTSAGKATSEPNSCNSLGERGQATPAAETSILGPIKIRKRQPSILRSIDGPDSSILDQDLEDFLPDDESTPLNASRKRKLSHSPKASPPAPPQPRAEDFEAGSQNTTNAAPDLPPLPSSAVSQRGQPLSEIDSDTMAPPQSSSSNPSPVKAKAPSPTKKKINARKVKEPKSLSTAALQALMPARRQQRTRRDRAAKATSEFDIPEDSSDPQNVATGNRTADPDAEESYIASARPTRKGKKTAQPMKLQKKKPPATRKLNTKPSQAEKREKEGGGTSSRGGRTRSQNTSTQSSPPTSTTRATPAAVAKTSSPQQQPQSTKDTRLRSYPQTAKEAAEDNDDEAEDKENRPSHSSASSSKRESGHQHPSRPGKPLSTDANTATAEAHNDDEDKDVSIEIARSYPRGHGGDDSEIETETELHHEQARLAQKFKDVDEWEMEFEDVTFDGSGMGSDPLAR